jgi:hypothetical protein
MLHVLLLLSPAARKSIASALRFLLTLRSDLSTVLVVLRRAEDWERELAKTLLQYSGCVDANILQYTWPVNFDKYRILLVGGGGESVYPSYPVFSASQSLLLLNPW